MPELSIIIPVFNEEKSIRQIIEKINSIDLNREKEVIVVNDGSTDGTGEILRGINYPNLTIINHHLNKGKGRAVLTGLSYAQGKFVIIQDADLEYNPSEYSRLLEAMENHKADLVMGAHFTKGYQGLLIPRLGNRLITIIFNFLFGVRLNDIMTCYKLVRKRNLETLGLCSKGFDIEIEIVAKAVKRKMKIIEVPISYSPRTYSEGKKIRWLDGLKAIGSILRYRFLYYERGS